MTKLKNVSTDIIQRFIWIFYSIGIVGIGIPGTREFFTYLIPFAFLVALVVLFIADRSDQRRFFPFAVALFFTAYIVELIGVNTGIIFGDFSFGRTLGPRIFNTPISIGLIWIILVYCATIIVSQFTDNSYFISFLATVLMVVFDMVLEGPAGILDMWNWDWAHIPMQNFLAWFVISWIFTGSLQLWRVELKNPVAGTLFAAQFVFFLILNLIFFVEQAVA